MTISRNVAVGLLALGLLAAGPARAAIFSLTPDLIPANSGFASSGGCFGPFGFCTSGLVSANYVLTSPPTFDAVGETLHYQATYTGALTDLDGNLLGTFTALGTDVFQIYGRGSATDVGAWNAALIDESVHVSAAGHTIDLNLDDSHNSLGQVSILPDGDGYDVSSTFAVYGEFAIDGSPAFDPGAFPIAGASLPEPASLTLLALPLLALRRLRRTRV